MAFADYFAPLGDLVLSAASLIYTPYQVIVPPTACESFGFNFENSILREQATRICENLEQFGVDVGNFDPVRAAVVTGAGIAVCVGTCYAFDAVRKNKYPTFMSELSKGYTAGIAMLGTLAVVKNVYDDVKERLKTKHKAQ